MGLLLYSISRMKKSCKHLRCHGSVHHAASASCDVLVHEVNKTDYIYSKSENLPKCQLITCGGTWLIYGSFETVLRQLRRIFWTIIKNHVVSDIARVLFWGTLASTNHFICV